jgi:hypothetical protein
VRTRRKVRAGRISCTSSAGAHGVYYTYTTAALRRTVWKSKLELWLRTRLEPVATMNRGSSPAGALSLQSAVS